MKLVLSLVLLAAVFIDCSSFTRPLKLVRESGSPSFNIFIDGEEWLKSGGLFVRSHSKWWSSTNKDAYILKQVGHSNTTGRDTFGNYMAEQYDWQGYKDSSTPDSEVKVQTITYMYADTPELLVFEIVYESGLDAASIPDIYNMSLSTFPSFVLEKTSVERGYITWAGNMAKDAKVGVWSPEGGGVYGDIDGGFPLVVFDATMATSVVMSPLNTFMSSNQMTLKDSNTGEQLVTFGPMNSIDTVPPGYSYKTILVSGEGVLSSMERYGELLRHYYHKDESYRRSDFSINYLGYWTDNGACYYYNTSSQYGNYDDLLKAVKKDADGSGIPYRYVQLDSWWYYKGKDNGVSKWTPRPDIFPNGIEPVVKETGWRVVAHNRWWSPETEYAKIYKFIVEDNIALPVDPLFWDYLISSSQLQWDLMVYEQDWLDYQFPRTKALLTTLGLGEMWLTQMGESAMRYGVTIQYCMPWTRHVLQSVAIPAVTQIRVSDDYQPGNSQWAIGDTTILAHAVGLAAFKDNFRTSTDQPDCKKYGHMTEEYPALETYVSALSGGPVGPSDQIGKYNKTLVMATCMMDGRLLKPSRPAMSIDMTFVQRAFGAGGPDGQLWAAYTVIGDQAWYFILGVDLKKSYKLIPKDLSPVQAFDQFIIAYQYSLTTAKPTQITLPYMMDNSLTISACGKEDFQYWAIATSLPSLPNGRFLLGELSKIVPVSEERFSNFDSSTVLVHGVPSEVVNVSVYDMVSNEAIAVRCVVSDDGRAGLYMGVNGGQQPYCSPS